MPEYIYVLTNPSMPGLLKVGKTTTSPSQRMKELHSTGVPTPFELECAFIVDDCTIRERHAHEALSKHRIQNREFFRIGVEPALRRILPTLGNYTVSFAKSAHGIDALSDKIQRDRDKKFRQEDAAREEYYRTIAATQELQKRRIDAEMNLNIAKGKIYDWYHTENASLFPRRNKYFYSAITGVVTFVALAVVDVSVSSSARLAWVGVAAWLGGPILQGLVEHIQANSSAKAALDHELENRLKAVNQVDCTCVVCGQSAQCDRMDLAINAGKLERFCSRCADLRDFVQIAQ